MLVETQISLQSYVVRKRDKLVELQRQLDFAKYE
jgi:hypothetical protein